MHDTVQYLLLAIPLAPLVAAILIAWGAPLGLKSFSPFPCVVALLVSAVAAGGLIFFAHGHPVTVVGPRWIDAGRIAVNFGLQADSLTQTMLAMVTFVSLLIAVYSIGYIGSHVGVARFFAAMSLFVFSMTLLVTANDFLVLFLAWELVGVCSYLLIGYYQDRPSAAAAARKAFLVNRIGDFGFLLGIFWIWTLMCRVAPNEAAKLSFAAVFEHAGSMAAYDVQGLTWACFLLFAGAVGKSAQFPLHVWLPDAMEGPSPVSALIHAATMVTAGVYFVARLSPVLVFVPTVQLGVATIGGLTALLAAAIALTQNDLKRVLAYSTVSQLGFMFAALGAAAGDDHLLSVAVAAALFHLFTHAFFKALLFLSAGSVMHAMGDVIDMRRFGGLRKSLPCTHLLFLCGAVALAGLPIFSGFWSKDSVLGVVAHAANRGGDYQNHFLSLKLALYATSLLTAFYTFRAYFMTFWGPERFPEEAGRHPHESPWVMLLPMAVLAVPALAIGGLLGPGLDVTIGGTRIAPVPAGMFEHFVLSHTPGLAAPHVPAHAETAVVLASIVLAVAGALAAWFFYVLRPNTPRSVANDLKPLYEASLHRFYFDEIYGRLIVAPLAWLARLLPSFDRHWLDRIVDLFGILPRWIGRGIRGIQNGYVQTYGTWMMVGLALLLLLTVGSKR